ncbi:VCBS domain-containing protein, partial [Acidimangrovimonas pyrenivorans]
VQTTASGAVQEDDSLSAAGQVAASDVDQGDSLSYTVHGGGAGSYGTLSVDGQGAWSYVLNNDAANVQALDSGDSVTDSFTIDVSDGNGGLTTSAVTVTVNGTDDNLAPVASDDSFAARIYATPTSYDEVETNDTLAKAMSLDGLFELSPDNSVNDSDINPHVTVNGTLSSNSDNDFYAFTVAEDGTQVVLDIDGGGHYSYKQGNFTLHGADVELLLENAKGQLVGVSYDAGKGHSDSGSTAGTSGYFNPDYSHYTNYTIDPYLVATLNKGTYYVRIDGQVGTNNAYTLHISQSDVSTAFDHYVDEDHATVFAASELLSNDSDPDGGTLSIQSLQTSDSSAASTTSITSAEGAIVTLNADGSLVYDPTASAGLNALAAGQVGSDSFWYTVSDGQGGTSSAEVTLSVWGINDAATITGTSAAAVTEDVGVVAGALTTSGSLMVSDPDAGEAQFQAQAGVGGDNGYGRFTLTEDGSWSYVADNSQTAIQELLTGQQLTDSFTATSVDGSATQVVTVTINGTDDTAVIGGTASGAVTEDSAVTAEGMIETGGTLVISDADTGQAQFQAQTDVAGNYGSFSLTPDGNWTYSADNALAAIQALTTGQHLSESFAALSYDGSASQMVVVTIEGTDDAAQIGGTATGAVTEDSAVTKGDLTASGVLTITDPDAGQASFQAQPDVAGDHGYGSFSLGANGQWSYAADNSQAAIQTLAEGEQATDSFTAVSADGSATQQVTVTLTGANDAPVAEADYLGVRHLETPTIYREGDLTSSGNQSRATAVSLDGFFKLSHDDEVTNSDSDAHVSVKGSLPNNHTDDFYAFTVTRDGTQVVLDIDHGGYYDNKLNGMDTELALMASDGTVIAKNDDEKTGDPGSITTNYGKYDPYITHTLAAGTYYVRVDATTIGNNKNYQLNVSTSDVAAAATSQVDADASLVLSAHELTANDSDIDSDALTLAAVTGSTLSGGHETWLSAAGATLTLDTATDTLTYDPSGVAAHVALAEGQVAIDSFSYAISDGHGGTATAMAQIAVGGVNDAPTLDAGTLSDGADNTTATLDVSTLGHDVDSDDSGTTLSYALVGDPTNGGSATISGSTLSFDPGSDFLHLAEGETAQTVFTLQATDAHGATVTSTLTVTVDGANQGPVFAPDAAVAAEAATDTALAETRLTGAAVGEFDGIVQNVVATQTLAEGGAIHLSLPSDVSTVFADPEGDALQGYELLHSYKLNASGGLVDLDTNTSLTHPDFSLDSSGTITATTDGTQQGYYLLEFGTSDSHGAASSDSVYAFLNVQNVVDNVNSNGFAGTLYDDIVSGGRGGDVIHGGNGYDTLIGNAGNDVIHGDAGNDLLAGGDDGDALYGDAGADTLNGDKGADTLHGGDGNDVLDGGKGSNMLNGDAGDDIFHTGAGTDTINGGDGTDVLDMSSSVTNWNIALSTGSTANGDYVAGQVRFGGDRYATLDSIENVTGGSGAEHITGNEADNVIAGNAGNDVIDGGAGKDILSDGAGNDTVIGGDGNDILYATEGTNQLTGGSTSAGGLIGEADLFVFGSGQTQSVVTDFDVGADHLYLLDHLDVTGVQDWGSPPPGGTLAGTYINLSNDETIILEDVHLGSGADWHSLFSDDLAI